MEEVKGNSWDERLGRQAYPGEDRGIRKNETDRSLYT